MNQSINQSVYVAVSRCATAGNPLDCSANAGCLISVVSLAERCCRSVLMDGVMLTASGHLRSVLDVLCWDESRASQPRVQQFARSSVFGDEEGGERKIPCVAAALAVTLAGVPTGEPVFICSSRITHIQVHAGTQ